MHVLQCIRAERWKNNFRANFAVFFLIICKVWVDKAGYKFCKKGQIKKYPLLISIIDMYKLHFTKDELTPKMLYYNAQQ